MGIRLEHANVTVSDPKASAAVLAGIFRWRVRWEGPGAGGSYGVHVGTEDAYVALTDYGSGERVEGKRYHSVGMLNHLAVFTDEDIDAVEDRVKAAGFEPMKHGDYAPGRRFYFLDGDGIEWEVASHQR